MLAIARRLTDESEERGATHAAYDTETAAAWRKEDPEFGNLLWLAVMLGDVRPLKEYLCSEKPLSRFNQLGAVADVVAGQILTSVNADRDLE